MGNSIYFTNIYIFVLAVVLAILEIQIEGEHGWAKNLPTWRSKFKRWLGGKEVTGYHLMLFLFIVLMFHLTYAFGRTWNILEWVQILSLLSLFFVLWDFLWFVLNPHYPLKKFKKEHIDWHQCWIFGMPVEYIGGIILSFIVLLPFMTHTLFFWWLQNVGLFGVWTILVIIFSLWVLKIDTWKST